MDGIRQGISGWVWILLDGEQLERFLNLCRARNILLRKVNITKEGKMTAILSIKDCFRLRPILRKTRVHIHILKKRGLPFFLERAKKKKAFLTGAFLCALLLIFLSGRIWSIRIEGNVSASTPELLRFLTEQGITCGLPKREISCSSIAAMVRQEYPAVTWVSARIEGARLLLFVREAARLQNREEEASPASLVSSLDGEIVHMVTRKGTPAVGVGDVCKKGDLLIAGWVDIRNDSQEVVRRELVRADGDVYVRRRISYEEGFLLRQKIRKDGEEKKTFYSLQIGDWRLDLAGKKEKSAKRVTELFPLRLTEGFVLPVIWGRITDTPQINAVYTMTQEEARSLAVRRLCLYQEKIIKKGVQILENNVKIEVNDTRCISRGTFTVVEKTEAFVPSVQNAPTERKPQDG